MLHVHYEGLLRGDACDVVVQLLSESEPPGAARTLALTRRVEMAYGDGSSVEALCESSVEIEAADDWDGTLADWITSLTSENEGVMRLSWTDPATGADCVWSGGIAPGTLYDVALYPEIKRRALRVSAACGLVRLGSGAPAWAWTNELPSTTIPALLAPLFTSIEPTESARTVDYAPSARPSPWRALGVPGTAAHWLLDTAFRPSKNDDQGTPARDAASALLAALGLRVRLGLDGRWHVDSTSGEGASSTSVLRVDGGASSIVSRADDTRALLPGRVRADATVTRSAPPGSVDVSLALSGAALELVRNNATTPLWGEDEALVYYESETVDGEVFPDLFGGQQQTCLRATDTGGYAILRSVLCRVKEGEGLRFRCEVEHKTQAGTSALDWRIRLRPDDPAAVEHSGVPGTGWTSGEAWKSSPSDHLTTVDTGDVAGPIPATGLLMLEMRVTTSTIVMPTRPSVRVGTWREGEAAPEPGQLPAMVLPRTLSGLVQQGAGKGRETKADLPTHDFRDGDWQFVTTNLGGIEGGHRGEVAWFDENGVQRWTLQNLVGARLLGLKRRAEVTTDGLLVPGTRALLDVPGAGEVAFIVASCRVDLARYTTKATLVTP